EALLAMENLPITGVKRVSEVVRDPHVKARGLLPVVDVSGLWKLQVIAHPAKHATLETRNPTRVPAKGQDTEEILRSLGYTASQERLRQADRDGRLSSESAGEFADLGRERFVLHGLRHEADRGCFVGGEPKPEKHEFLRLRLTEHSDEPLGPARPGNEAQIHLGLSELGPLRRDPEVAGQGQFEPASEAMTVD